MIMWSLWFHSNLHYWEAKDLASDQIIHVVVVMFFERQSDAQHVFDSAQPRSATSSFIGTGWNCNIDVARFGYENSTSFAVEIRDDDGRMIKRMLRYICSLMEPQLAEIFAVKEALSWLRRLKFD